MSSIDKKPVAHNSMGDWDIEDITAAIRKHGSSLSKLADDLGVTRQSIGQALIEPRESSEVAIASVIGVDPFVIWPSRYAAAGVRFKPQPRQNYGLPPRRIREAKRAALKSELPNTATEPLDPMRRMTGNLTLKDLGFDLNLVERNRLGDCLGSSIERVALMLVLSETPLSKPRPMIYAQRRALDRAICKALGRDVSLVVCAGSKADRSRCADILGFSEIDIWPYASATPDEKRRIDIALAEAATTAEPLDPISPLPDLPPAEDAAATQTTRLFVQTHIGIIIEGRRYWHPSLAAYASHYVDTRYDWLNDALIVLGEDGEAVCTATRHVRGAPRDLTFTLPPPTEPWMGALHEAFSASPADTANAVLRKRVAELEASLLDTKRHSEDAMRLLNDAVAHSKKCTDAMEALFAENAELRAAPLYVYNFVDRTSQSIDDYYNGNSGASHAQQMAVNEAAYLSQRTAQLDRLDFNIEMAAWPPVYEAPGPLRRFANCLSESVTRLIAKGARA